MSLYKFMKLKQNICDTVKEWEIKIGYREEEIQLYYPEESLVELLETNRENLKTRLDEFCTEVQEDWGKVLIYETEEKGRYCIKIPSQGVAYVHLKVPENVFLKKFLKAVTVQGARLEDICSIFYQFSDNVIIDKAEKREWGIWFQEKEIDPYVYYVEEDEFGLEYHRFTQEAYQKLK